MNLKRFVFSAVSLTLSVGLLAGCGGTKPAANAPASSAPAGGAPAATPKAPIKVGAVFIITGADSGYGISPRFRPTPT